MSGDLLLAAISTLGHMDRKRFEEAYDDLLQPRIDATDKEWSGQRLRWRYLECLDALGHCELSADRRRITVCPPRFVRLPGSGCPRAVLMGARDPSQISNLKAFATQNPDDMIVNEISQDYADCPLPSVVLVEAASIACINDCAKKYGVGHCSPEPLAWQLLCLSGDMQEYRGTLTLQRHIPPTGWLQTAFDLTQLRFQRAVSEDDPRLVSYQNPNDHQVQTWWIEGDQGTPIDRSWGQYLALNHAKQHVLSYDARRQILAVPETVPLPRLLARATTLCSGQIMRCKFNGKWLLVYRNVPKCIADGIESKLQQSLFPAEFAIKGEDES